MRLQRVIFYQYRNIESADLILSDSVNVFSGKNAQGKTNALEAIYLMAQGRSFRTVKEKEMIRFSGQQAAIRIYFAEDGNQDTQTMEIRLLPNGKRQCFHNGVAQRRLSEWIGHFRAVVFCPEHLALVKDGPAIRRAFLDMAISQLDPIYLHTLQEYGKVLQQRNAMLKSCRDCNTAFCESLEPWSVQLAAKGEILAAKRQAYMENVQTSVTGIFSDMTGGNEQPSLRYPEPKTADGYLQLLRSNIEREVHQQATLYGIHRDDFEIRLNGKEARAFASQGQQRSIALAMKLAEGEISRRMTGQYPVFLLDDIFSELDADRRAYIINGLSEKQVIITSCEDSVIPAPAASVWKVSGGCFTPVP